MKSIQITINLPVLIENSRRRPATRGSTRPWISTKSMSMTDLGWRTSDMTHSRRMKKSNGVTMRKIGWIICIRETERARKVQLLKVWEVLQRRRKTFLYLHKLLRSSIPIAWYQESTQSQLSRKRRRSLWQQSKNKKEINEAPQKTKIKIMLRILENSQQKPSSRISLETQNKSTTFQQSTTIHTV